ncbi:MAG: ComEC/Rec2 family competence protein [Butyricicoccus sp.]
MKRPLIAFSLCFAVGTAVELYIGVREHMMLWLLLLPLCAVLPKAFPKLFPAALCVAGIVCGMVYSTAYERYVELPFCTYENTARRITVIADEYPTEYDNQQRLEVRIPAEELGLPTEVHTLLYLPLSEDDIQPGDRINVRMEFYRPSSTEDFDRETYYRSIGCPLLASATEMTEITVTHSKHIPLRYLPKRLGHRFRETIVTLFPERQSSFLQALLLGDRSALSRIDTNHLRKAGLSHVIAVSGLHVGFLLSLILLLFGQRIGSVIGIPLLTAFVLMVGASPSVIRASIMYSVVLLAFLFRREADGVNSLFAALLLVLLWKPAALLSVSLQLSFASTLGILCLAGRMQHAFALPKKHFPYSLRRLWSGFTAAIACSASSLLVTCPILLYHFSYLSVLAPLSNLLTLWAVSLLFPLGLIVCITSLFSTSIATIAAVPASLLTRYIWAIADFVSGYRGGLLYVQEMAMFILAIVFCAGCIAALYRGNTVVCRGAVLLFLVIPVVYGAAKGDQTRRSLRFTCLNEGYGQCIVVTCGEQVALIDCGKSGYHNAAEDAAVYLDWWNYDHIDTLVLTAYNESHAGAAQEIVRMLPTYTLYAPYTEDVEKNAIWNELAAQCNTAVQPTVDSGLTSIESMEWLSVAAVEDKLAVCITSQTDKIWVVHSLTQNRIRNLYSRVPMNCSILVASYSLMVDREKQTEILKQLNPDEIVLETGWETSKTMNGISMRSTKDCGDITFVYPAS